MKRFVILDGSSLLYRAFFALPLLSGPNGEYTNAVLGFSNMLSRLLDEWEPDALAIAFDKGKKTFRNELFPQYKGTRKKTPEELSSQIPLLHEFAAALGIPLVEKEGYEADDIIGTLATGIAGGDWESLVVTGDRDALQLIRPNLRVVMTKKGISDTVVYDEAAFEEEYGLPPIGLIDLKGLMGDSSDNIPGVPGVGQKTAAKLLKTYGTLEAVLDAAGEISGKKLRENIESNREQALLSKRLATIDCNVPGLSAVPEEYGFNPDKALLGEFCLRHGMKTVEKKFSRFISEKTGDESEPSPAETVYVREIPVVEANRPEDIIPLKAANAIAISPSYERDGEGTFPGITALTAMGDSDGRAFRAASGSPAFSEILSLLEKVPVVFAIDLKKICHGGIEPGKNFLGLELAGYLLSPEASGYGLPALMERELSEALPPSCPKGEEGMKALEAGAILRLGEKLREKLEAAGLGKIYKDMELPLVSVLASMEDAGIRVDREHLEEKSRQAGDRLTSIEEDIYALAGERFNINSPRQLGEVLFERLGLPRSKKTKTGYSTNADVLENLRFEHPVVESILKYRTLAKLKSTYLDSIGDLIRNGRVHTTFNQTVAATGRLSSSDPNLQNIPVRTEDGKEIRALFFPGEEYDFLLSADYSQIELRLLAHMSGDKNFIDAFLSGQDVHSRTAAEVFGVPIDDVTPEMRRKAKAVNFGIVYGISDYGLSRDLRISRKEAGEYIKLYFSRYPGVKEFLDETVEKAHRDGYVSTLFGRKRSLPGIHSSNYNQRTLAERMAMNTPIQGTAADIIKLAMISVHKKLKEAKVKSRLLLQVHDELVLEVVRGEADLVSDMLRESMEHATELSVPLAVDIAMGKTWAEAK